MIIRTNTWHYRLYRWNYWDRENIPERTNLCQYVRRLSLTPLTALVSTALECLGLVGLICYTIANYGFGFLFGYVPNGWNPTTADMVKYPGMPLGRFQLYPWHVILTGLIVALHVWMYSFPDGRPYLLSEAKVVGIFLAVIALVVGLIFLFCSDTSTVVKQYLTAKKQKVCPIVEFEEKTQEK